MFRPLSATVSLGIILSGITSFAQPTPPIAPKSVDTSVPAVITVPAAAFPSDLTNAPLSANEAVKIALVHQPTLESAVQAIKAAKGRTQQVRSGELPQLNIGASYENVESLNTVNGQSSTVGVGVSLGYTATAELRQLLFDFTHTRDLVRQSSLLEASAKDSLARARNDLALQTKLAFYIYSDAKRALKVSEESLASRQKELDLAQARLKSGLGLPSDVARAQTSKAQGVTSLSLARANETAARINLALVMGIDPRTPINIGTTIEPEVTSNDMNAMVIVALKQRPEILEAEHNLQSTNFGLNAAKSTNAPAFSANLGLASRGTNFPPTADTFSLGVSVNWNPFDGGFAAGKVKEAKANQSIAAANKRAAELQVISDVAQAYAALRNAEQRIVAARNSVTNAEEGLRIATGRFTSGLGLFLDITDAESALESAKSDLTNAQFSVDESRSNLSHAIGGNIP